MNGTKEAHAEQAGPAPSTHDKDNGPAASTHAAKATRAQRSTGLLWGLIVPVCLVYPLVAPARAGDWAELAAGVFVQLLGCVGTLFPLFSIVLYGACGLRAPWLLPDRVAELCTVFVLWNTYTVWYALYIVPFAVMAWFGRAGCGGGLGVLAVDQTFQAAAFNYLAFVTFVPSPIIMVTAIWKIFIGRMRWNSGWSWKQQAVLGCLFAPMTIILWHYYYYHRARVECYLILTLTLLHYFYVCTTVVDRPEVSGRRVWPRFRAWFVPHFIDLVLAKYFDMRMLFDTGDDDDDDDDRHVLCCMYCLKSQVVCRRQCTEAQGVRG